MQNLPEVNNPLKTIIHIVTIQLGCFNIGYVLTYLTLSIDTIFANLHIGASEKTSRLSLINGILPLGCFVGAFIGHFMKKLLSNKHCLFLADLIGLLNLFTLIETYETIVAFRFCLGLANGFSSLLMPVYVKSMCPERYFSQVSLAMGYWVNTGLFVGQLMGIGYINYHGYGTSWWRVVFIVPSLICLVRLSVLFFFFNYESPEQLIQQGKESEAKCVVEHIYKQEYVEKVMEGYQKQAKILTQDSSSFLDIFQRKKLVTLQIGILAMLIQIWCGAFAVFYYSAQIFDKLSGDDLTTKTIYTFCIGLFSFFAQFSTIYLIRILGTRYLLTIGSILMGATNIAIAAMSSSNDQGVLFGIFVLMVLLICFFATTIGPIAWSIVPQVNDSNATFVSIEGRWAFQAILIFLFPYMVEGFEVAGGFYLFGALDLAYSIYALLFIIDSRGMTNSELVQRYHQKYRVLPTSDTTRTQNE